MDCGIRFDVAMNHRTHCHTGVMGLATHHIPELSVQLEAFLWFLFMSNRVNRCSFFCCDTFSEESDS